jgi:uncharacterized protein YbjT (DUF2867 family)
MILVTGVSGSNGSELIQRLSAADVPVRAMVRGRRTRALPGVEFVEADFDQPASLGRALEGVDRAFLVTNSSERVEEQQLGFVEAARKAGVKHLVYLSQLHASRNSPVRFLRYHAAVENAIAISGMEFTYLRPNLFMQGLLAFRAMIVAEGRFLAPMGEARVSLVDVRDIAAVAAAALTEKGHEGKTYDLTGPRALTHTEMADQLAETLGTPIAFADAPEAAMREMLRSWRMPEWQADGLIEDYGRYRRGEAADVSNAVREITGTAPRSFRDFARDYRRAFLVGVKSR